MASKVVFKATLILFNFLVWLSVAVLLGLGIYELTKPNYIDVANISHETPLQFIKLNAYVLIAIAGFVFILGFIGCCGSLKQHRCLIGVYLVGLIVVILAESVLLVVLFITKQEIMIHGSAYYTNLLRNFNFTAPSAFEFSFHRIQLTNRCCGVTNALDYNSNRYPGSCCFLPNINDYCLLDNIPKRNYGCLKHILNEVYYRIHIDSVILISFLTIQMIAFLIGIFYSKKIRKYEPYDNYFE